MKLLISLKRIANSYNLKCRPAYLRRLTEFLTESLTELAMLARKLNLKIGGNLWPGVEYGRGFLTLNLTRFDFQLILEINA